MKWVSLMVGSSESPSMAILSLPPFEEQAYRLWTTTHTSFKNMAVTMTEQVTICS